VPVFAYHGIGPDQKTNARVYSTSTDAIAIACDPKQISTSIGTLPAKLREFEAALPRLAKNAKILNAKVRKEAADLNAVERFLRQVVYRKS
jgi:hypothetical protein